MNALDVDTRSDVYSLGVLLYELLTGSTPFDRETLRQAGFDEMRRLIREVDPPRPSQQLSTLGAQALSTVSGHRGLDERRLPQSLRGELDWIVMKALDKDRDRRYETASALAGDLQHYLNDEPVVACPPSAAYRYRKFARRNKAVLGTILGVALALIAGICGTTWQAVRAISAERSARESEQRAIDERNQKEAARSKAFDSEKKAAEEAAVAKAINEFLQQDLLGLARPSAQLESQIEPDPDLKLITLVERALAKVDERFAEQPRVRAEIQATLASVFESVDRHEHGVQLWQQVLEYRRRTLGPEHFDTLDAMSNLAEAFRYIGQDEKSLELHEQVLEMRGKSQGAEHRETLNAISKVAYCCFRLGQTERAISLLEKTLEQQRRLLGADTEDTLSTMNCLAVACAHFDRLDLAVRMHEEVLSPVRKRYPPEHLFRLLCQENLARIYFDVGRYAEAIELLRPTVEARRRVQGPQHGQTSRSLHALGCVYYEAGQFTDAIPVFEEAVDLRRKFLKAEEQGMTQVSMGWLIAAYRYAGQFDKSLSLSQELLDIYRHQTPQNPADIAWAMSAMAAAMLKQEKWSEAEQLLRESLAIWPDADGEIGRINAQHLLGAALRGQQKFADAEPLLLEGRTPLLLEARTKMKSFESNPNRYRLQCIQETHEQLIGLYEDWGKTEEAAKWRGQAR
jgi:tetratricopeptide (TPR) repeat protein